MSLTENGKATLATLAKGAAIERFDDELQRVLNNIIDPNTAEGKRCITLKVEIKPDPDRVTAAVHVSCSSKLMPSKPCSTLFYVGKERGQGVAFEHNPEQLAMNLETASKPTVISGGKQ